MSKLFSPKIQTPEVKPPAPLPDTDQTDEAGRRRVRRERSRAGVQSTILSTAGSRETLGG